MPNSNNWYNRWGKAIAGVVPHKRPKRGGNVLPGGLTFSAPAIGQYDSGEITISVDLANPDPVVTAINSEKYGYISGGGGGTMNFNSKNIPSQWLPSGFVIGGYNGGVSNPNNHGLYFRPETPWNGISKIKVYTNLIQVYDEYGDEINGGYVNILACARYEHYKLSNPTQLAGNNGGAVSTGLFNFYTNKTIEGTPVTGNSPNTSPNIGDPGTLWGELYSEQSDFGSIGAPGQFEGTFIGNKTLGTVPYPYTFPLPQGTPVEYYYSSYISFQMNLLCFGTGIIPDLKFRFIIEYY